MIEIVGVLITIVATHYLIKLWIAARIPFDPQDELLRISRLPDVEQVSIDFGDISMGFIRNTDFTTKDEETEK